MATSQLAERDHPGSVSVLNDLDRCLSVGAESPLALLPLTIKDESIMNNPILDTSSDVAEVASGEVLSFVKGMSLSNREAAKYCHLFASQAATAAHHPNEEGQKWFEVYIQTMQACGWVSIKYTYSKEKSSNREFTMDGLMVHALAGAVSLLGSGGTSASVLPVVAGNALKALDKADEAISVISRNAVSKQGTSLSVASCMEQPNGEVIMTVGAVQVNQTPDKKTGLLFFSWSGSNAETYTGSAAFTFHRSLYERNKDVVEGEVADNARKTLLSLKLKR